MSRTALLCAFLAAAAAGCASSPSTPTAQRAPSAAKDPLCVQASRITSATCSTPGRKWSGTDLDRTGQTNAADALSYLDPSVQAHHN